MFSKSVDLVLLLLLALATLSIARPIPAPESLCKPTCLYTGYFSSKMSCTYLEGCPVPANAASNTINS